MNLESARSLKRELLFQVALERHLPYRTSAQAHAWTGAMLQASDLTYLDMGVGVGIAVLGPRKHGLAVRLQETTPRAWKVADQAKELARGEVDVRFIGPVRAQHAQTERPLRPGISIGHPRGSAGTLGAFVTIADQPGTHVLSNNHVIAACNHGAQGDPVLQPGPADGGEDPDNRIGTLARFVHLRPSQWVNSVDAAVCLLSEDLPFEPVRHPSGPLIGPADPEGDVQVEKVGRTSSLTCGTVTALEVDGIWVEYANADRMLFSGQIEVTGEGATPFSEPGDSGSLVYRPDTREAVGLLFAGTEAGYDRRVVSYANPLRAVFAQLGAALWA